MASTPQPTRQPRRADAERNIAAILETARDLFAGGASPSMSEIARAAGVGRVTLYAHFPSREALLEAVVERAIAEADQALAERGPERLRRHHDQAFHHIERVIARGQREGVFRTDLPRGWLVTAFYAILHAATDEVDAGRLDAADAPGILTATVLPLLHGPC